MPFIISPLQIWPNPGIKKDIVADTYGDNIKSSL